MIRTGYLLKAFKRRPSIFSDITGNVAITFSLVSAVITAMAGGAIDFAVSRTHDEALQHAVDATALEAAITYGGSQNIDTGHLTDFFLANYNMRGGAGMPLVSVVAHNGYYTASASLNMPTLFLGLAGISEIAIDAEATAETVASVSMCVLLLEPREIGLELNSHARIDSDCGFYVNSRNSEAIHANSQSVLQSAANLVVGGSYINSGSILSPTPFEGVVALSDPMAGFPAPSDARRSGCDHTDMVIDRETTRINPGIYCGLIFNSGADVTMAPGVYVIRDGEFLINSQSSGFAEEVTIYLEGENAGLTVNSDSSLTVTAPRSGAYEGIAIFQSPDVDGADIYLNSGADGRIEGLVYAPSNQIHLNSRTTTNNTSHDNMVIIARDMFLNSHSRLNIRMDGTSIDLPDEVEAFVRAAGYSARLVR